jgi:hypothetical protein
MRSSRASYWQAAIGSLRIFGATCKFADQAAAERYKWEDRD